MQIEANTPEEYIQKIPQERQAAMKQLRETILQNLPEGFHETISYGMIGYVVPHSIYPGGYHCTPELPLPFMNIASQKHYIALYHSGIYADNEIKEWFVSEYPNHCSAKLDMGKSCIRFKKIDEIPYALIAELVRKMSVQQWIDLYEAVVKTK
ncbi:DUF1801 domain-containing protein [Prolixibacteraceae bacterium JC049]|nr:DUF1801 domain-containing protein [Prolixibacteraceae bacterium JC049]